MYTLVNYSNYSSVSYLQSTIDSFNFRRSLSLIEPVKEEDENALMEEIDQLARQRNSSLAPSHFKQTLKAIRQVSIRQRLIEWYNDLYWPYDYEETILGLRYFATGFLLLAAFLSLLFTFLGSKTVKAEL